MTAQTITVETTVNAPVERVWNAYTTPDDIMQWNSASDDWHTPSATVDLREGGLFSTVSSATLKTLPNRPQLDIRPFL